jgi:hypothetical protein
MFSCTLNQFCANHTLSAPQPVPTLFCSADPRMRVKQSSISGSDLTPTRSHTLPARVANSSVPVVVGGPEVSRSRCCFVGCLQTANYASVSGLECSYDMGMAMAWSVQGIFSATIEALTVSFTKSKSKCYLSTT